MADVERKHVRRSCETNARRGAARKIRGRAYAREGVMARQMTRLRLALGHPLWSSGGESEEERGKPFSHSAQTSLGVGLAAVLRALARAHWRAACGERSVGCRVGAASLGEFREVDAKFGKCWRPVDFWVASTCHLRLLGRLLWRRVGARGGAAWTRCCRACARRRRRWMAPTSARRRRPRSRHLARRTRHYMYPSR